MKAILAILVLGGFGILGGALPGAPQGWAMEPRRGCPRCGCQAGHCGAGIPSHMNCGSATPADRERVQGRVNTLKNSIDQAVSPEVKNCNVLVQKVAASMGYRGFSGMTADQMLEHLAGSEANVKRAVAEGWTFLSPDATPQRPTPMSVDEAMQYANAGRMVIALVHSGMRNQVKPPGDNGGQNYTHGHAFIVMPGGRSGDGWKGCPVANAGSGRDPSARKTQANLVTREWERPIFTFWVLAP